MSLITKEDLVKHDWYSWMMECAYLPSREKYGFSGFEYLKKITQVPWKPGDERFLSKSAQCGGSELCIDWMFWMAERNLPNFRGIGYLFPAMEQLQDHIKARIMPILEVPRFQMGNKLKECNLRFIKYNNIPIYFRSGGGARSGAATKALKGWPADAVVVDEFDEYEDPITIIPAVQARLNASQYKWILGLSTPTHPDTGIDKAAGLSSQYNWYVHCDCCKKQFSPLNEVKISGFENCVVRSDKLDTVGFLCPSCHDITNTNKPGGEWILDVDKSKRRTAYFISRLFLENSNLEELYDKYEEALNIQEFYNSDLGLPYSPPNSKLKRKDLVDCANGDLENKSSSDKGTWAGVDVGKKCYYAIGLPDENGNKKVISYGECTFDQVETILKKFNVKTAVIDLRPYEHEVKKILRQNRRYFGCDFNTGNQEDWYKKQKADSDTTNRTVNIVKADRTQSCDNLIEQIIRKRYVFPGQIKGDNNFIMQMCSPMRLDRTDKLTGDIKSYYKSAGKKDHYFFAMSYLNLAFNLKKALVAKVGRLFL